MTSFVDTVKKILVPDAAMLPVWVIVASVVTLATAHGFEQIGGLAPCALCLEQRLAYWLAIGIAAPMALLYQQGYLTNPLIERALLAGIVLVLGWGACRAGFHTGVEYGWWEGPPSCTSTGARSLEDMLSDGVGDIVMCDEIPWSLLGISMAGYNSLIALSLTIYAALGLKRTL